MGGIPFSDWVDRNDEGTLDLIKSNNIPNVSHKEISDYYNSILKEKIDMLRDFKFYNNIKIAVDTGYRLSSEGNLLNSAYNNRFIIEKGCLSIFIDNTTSKYYDAIVNMDWHKLVDDRFVINSFGEAMHRIRKIEPNFNSINGRTIFLAGKPVCDKHVSYIHYAAPIKSLTNKRVLCQCGKEARYFILPMPKVSALIGLSCYIAHINPSNLSRAYSNLSRIIHPYGFIDFDRDKSLALWIRDLNTILNELIKMKDNLESNK